MLGNQLLCILFMLMQNSCLLCIVNSIPENSVLTVLQARLLEVLLDGCNRVINHVEEVSSALSTLLPSACEFLKFWQNCQHTFIS